MPFLTHLECSKCGEKHAADRPQTVCTICGKPLLSRYDLEAVKAACNRDDLLRRPATLWRYREVLPVADDGNIVTLGEGFTPLLPANRLGEQLGLPRLMVKDESQIPTGTFKARGLAMAVSRAKEFGLRRLAIPSAGNAAGALAAYAARAGLETFIFMPQDAPDMNKKECDATGAHLYLVEGLISDCGKIVAGGKAAAGWFDVSTLKEPYRVEGKKTMGYELAEQLGWTLPDAIIYPTGGGTGLIGMWKAFAEMQELGWIGPDRPRMITVQSSGCAPIVRAFEAGAQEAEFWQGAQTVAAGLRVPAAIGDFLMLQVLRQSGGTAIAVSDTEILDEVRRLAQAEGLFACPEGAATVAAARHLREDGVLSADDRVVLFNTGAGMKYPEAVLGEYPVLDPRQTVDYGRF